MACDVADVWLIELYALPTHTHNCILRIGTHSRSKANHKHHQTMTLIKCTLFLMSTSAMRNWKECGVHQSFSTKLLFDGLLEAFLPQKGTLDIKSWGLLWDNTLFLTKVTDTLHQSRYTEQLIFTGQLIFGIPNFLKNFF